MAVVLHGQTSAPSSGRGTIAPIGDYNQIYFQLALGSRDAGAAAERQEDWTGALSAYEDAARRGSQIPTGYTPAGYLLGGTAYLDSARMLARLGRESEPEYANYLNSAEWLLQKALEAGAVPQVSVYVNLGMVSALKGDLAQSVNYFDKSSAVDPNFTAARTSAQALRFHIQQNPQLTKTEGLSPETKSKLRGYAIDVGVFFVRKEFPIAGPLTGLTLNLINALYSAPAKR
jgi:tetratricopeptide (TPR) repeat protein